MRLWVNGDFHDSDERCLSALDHGFLVGDGVFETLKVVDGEPFALTRHLRRLAASAAGLGLSAPEEDQVRQAALQVCAGEPVARGRLRITLTSGPGPLSSERGPGDPTLTVALTPVAAWPPATKVVVVPWVRNERSPVAGLKTTSYAENVVALAEAKRQGASEALMANTRGDLCEGTGSNVVVRLDGEWVTPPLTSGCLAGITRALLLQWAGERGTPIREGALPLASLDAAEEIVLTSSTRDVQPVEALGARALVPGPVAWDLVHMFQERASHDLDPT